MITDPKIAGVILQGFKLNDGGGNSWEYTNEDKHLRFVTYPSDNKISTQVKISRELKEGGFTHLATIHFQSEKDEMKACDIRFSSGQKFSLLNEGSFAVGKTCFSKNWYEHVSTPMEIISRVWNEEKPPKEKVMYSAKELTVNSIKTIEEYSTKLAEID